MKNASHKGMNNFKDTKINEKLWAANGVFHFLTQGQVFRVPCTAWFVMCHQETLTVKQWLLLHEARVPHFNFFQVAGQLRVEDDYYTVRVLHQSWPACFKPWKTQKMARLIAGQQKHAVELPQVFFLPQEHIKYFLNYNISNLDSYTSYSKYFDLW